MSNIINQIEKKIKTIANTFVIISLTFSGLTVAPTYKALQYKNTSIAINDLIYDWKKPGKDIP